MISKPSTIKENTDSILNIELPKESVSINPLPLSRNFGLDLARTIAISLVVVSHFGHNALDALGFWGVELFFALSGFLIGQILWRNFSRTDVWAKSHIVNFWQRRWWRTLPNYYLFFFILLISAYINKEEIPSIIGLSKFMWFGQFLLNHNWGFYSVSWSLCIEEWFYFLFPIFLFIFGILIRNRKISFVFSLVCIITGSIIVRSFLANQDSPHYLRGITLARLDAIAYGVVIAFLISTSGITRKYKYLALAIGILFQICAIASVYYLGLAHTVVSQFFLIIVPLGFALMIPSISLIAPPRNNYSIITNTIEKISLWSYSIYLSHGPLMWLVYFLLKNYRDTFYGNLLSKFIVLVVTLIASALLYKFFEVPFTKKRPKELK